MPIYEYICSQCKSEFELMRPLSQADKDAECPRCRNMAKRKISTFTAFTTSGSGIPTRVPGTDSSSSCSSCTSGNCSTCAS
ncbi:MAG: zinc ribbon domain-containing protein [Dehalococcoidales bacterium]|nr:zinc ribbon domain-containing protein [Dehalococcoidales bacterium]